MIWFILTIFLTWWLIGFTGIAFWWMGEFGDLEGYVNMSIAFGLITGIFSWLIGIFIHEPWNWYHPWRYDHRKPFWIND
jgi:hypothetical protein